MPPLAVSRLRAQSSLAVIDRAELLFTDDETRELFRTVFDLDLPTEQLVEYRQRTQGWITALQLVRQVAQRRALSTGSGDAPAPALSEILRQSERDIFDYFAEEVFADETDQAQYLLLRVSLLESIELEACADLYPEVPCAHLLPSLVRRNVFLTLASDERGEEYRLHPLFQDFLRRRLRSELGKPGLASEHVRSAAYFLGRGFRDQAVRHLLAAEDYDVAASLLAARGGEWIAAGALSSLVALVDALPASALEANPRALLHRAEAARLQGELERAAPLFRRAATYLEATGDAEGEAEACHALATIARRAGKFEAAFAHLDRAVTLSAADSPVRTKCGNTRGLCLKDMGKWADAEGEFRAALQLAEERGDEQYIRFLSHNLGLPAMMRGDFSEALRWLGHVARGEDARTPLPQEATGYLNVARCLLYRGELDAAERNLDHALELCQLFNLTAVRGEIYETYGNLYRERHDAAHAADSYERAARAYDDAGIDITRRELLEEQAFLYLQEGDVVSARATIDRLARTREESGDEIGRMTAGLALGRIMIAQGEAEEAHGELERSLGFFRSYSLYYYEAQALMALAACDWLAGREREMFERLHRTLDLAARYDYDYWLRREVAANSRMFSHPEVVDLLPPDVREHLKAVPAAPRDNAGVRSVRPVSAILSADLSIRMLGPVDIFRDQARPFAPDAWTTKRARDILCFVASRPHRRAQKDAIVDTFWGEADFATVEKNFHPTVSHIRKALNSKQPLKQNFLVYRDGDYMLNPDFSYAIDVEEFDRLIGEAEAARRARQHEASVARYEEAVALYRGEFMQGCYDDWVEEQRAYYREQYLRALEALADAARRDGEWTRTLDIAQRLLHDDPFREDMHCAVMQAHAALGHRGAVKEHYDGMCKLLKRELGVEPAPETKKVYRDSMA